VRGLAHQLDQERGRRYASRCDAVLGDARCGVALATPARRVVRVIGAVVDAGSLTVATPAGFGVGAFTGGTLRFDLGANAGRTVPVMSHTRVGSLDTIALWSPPPDAIIAGQQVTLTVGCDKRFETCRDVFSNAANFRGFPHIPGNDHVMAYARQGEAGLDGGAVVG
jgi:uncharacterized phage protein (TIGR02218 family)